MKRFLSLLLVLILVLSCTPLALADVVWEGPSIPTPDISTFDYSEWPEEHYYSISSRRTVKLRDNTNVFASVTAEVEPNAEVYTTSCYEINGIHWAYVHVKEDPQQEGFIRMKHLEPIYDGHWFCSEHEDELQPEDGVIAFEDWEAPFYAFDYPGDSSPQRLIDPYKDLSGVYDGDYVPFDFTYTDCNGGLWARFNLDSTDYWVFLDAPYEPDASPIIGYEIPDGFYPPEDTLLTVTNGLILFSVVLLIGVTVLMILLIKRKPKPKSKAK